MKKKQVNSVADIPDPKEAVNRDPMLLRFYLARVAAHGHNSPLSYEDEFDEAIRAYNVWQHNERIAVGLEGL